MKWLSEKHIEHRMETCTVTRAQAIGSAEACLVSRNDPMHDSVPYLRNSLPNDTDILHEYFIPRSQFVSFVDGMRKVLTDNKTNLLNASVRIVHQEGNFLTYSPEPAFSLVLYINQSTDEEGNRRMKKATEEPSRQEAAMGFEVFKGLPMPKGPKKKYNFEDLEVGDMMFVPIAEAEDHTAAQNKMSSAAAGWGRRRDRKFATQLVKNDGKLGIGVWRIE